MFCEQCGAQLRDNMKFCPKCGARQPGTASPLNQAAPGAPGVQPQYGQPAQENQQTFRQEISPAEAETVLMSEQPEAQYVQAAPVSQPAFRQEDTQPAQAPAAEESVFDFSMVGQSGAASPEVVTGTTTMTPPRRSASRGSTPGRRKGGIAALIAGIAVVLAGAAFAVYWTDPGTTAERYVAKAEEFMTGSAYDEAIDEYDKALAADPENVQAYNGKASALVEQGELEQAAEVLREGYIRTSSYLLSSRCDEIENELYSK